MALRAVLFDAAGTLIRTAEPVGETYAREARARGVELPAWRLEDAFERVLRRAPPMVFPEAPPSRIPVLERQWWRRRVRETLRAADSTVRFADFDAWFEALYRHFARPEAWRDAPGAAEALAALRKRGLATAVVSNFDHRLEPILEGLGLRAQLDAVVRPADAGAVKPDPRIFRRALEHLGTRASEAVYVGDDAEHDVAGARAAGLRAIDVAELATLADLPERLDSLGAPAEEPIP
jgi:putative hydrolase of the HAD superfamily